MVFSAGKDQMPSMKKRESAVCLSALCCGILLTGCGNDNYMHRAEHQHSDTTASVKSETDPETRTETDRDNALYEEDDVHRRTDKSEPDILDRAESAMDSVESVLTDAVTEAEKKLDEMHGHDYN